MSDFALHPQLERDCHRLGRLRVCHILLHRNAAVPWWILVPEVAERELCEIERARRTTIDREIDALAEFVLSRTGVEKLNIAAIGNLVPQLHIHIVGRNPDDACWPQPVWGHLQSNRAYTNEALARLSEDLASALRDTSAGPLVRSP